MLDLRLVREEPDSVRAALARRDATLPDQIDLLVTHDSRRRQLLGEVEELKARRNRQSTEVAERKQAGQEAGSLLADLKNLSERIKQLDEDLRDTENARDHLALQLPNLPLTQVPDGDASHNEIVRTWGEPRSFPFTPRPHWELGEALGILDLPRGARIAGSGFPLFRGRGARLVRGLQHFMLDLHTTEHGYEEIAPPLLLTAEAARGTGQLPDKEGTMYVTEDGLYLVPTAEVPLTNMHGNEVLAASELPIAYTACTPCFRREAGAHGKDTRGLIRVHQFDKVELVRLVRPEDSATELELLLGHAESVLQRLGLPYRVVKLAVGDLGFASALTYDLEVWTPGLDRWLEVSSASTFTDFQARRALIRYRPTPDAKPEFVHTLNASGVAFPRTIIALLENGQDGEGGVSLPGTLAPYVGFERLTP